MRRKWRIRESEYGEIASEFQRAMKSCLRLLYAQRHKWKGANEKRKGKRAAKRAKYAQ